MRKFSSKSNRRLQECHPDLQLLCNAVLQDMDITILCGYRGKEEQDEAYRAGKSKLKFPHSKHNRKPSMAVDVAPYPVDWNNIERFKRMCELFEVHAEKLDIEIRLGRDFTFSDFPHIELIGKKYG